MTHEELKKKINNIFTMDVEVEFPDIDMAKQELLDLTNQYIKDKAFSCTQDLDTDSSQARDKAKQIREDLLKELG